MLRRLLAQAQLRGGRRDTPGASHLMLEPLLKQPCRFCYLQTNNQNGKDAVHLGGVCCALVWVCTWGGELRP